MKRLLPVLLIFLSGCCLTKLEPLQLSKNMMGQWEPLSQIPGAQLNIQPQKMEIIYQSKNKPDELLEQYDYRVLEINDNMANLIVRNKPKNSNKYFHQYLRLSRKKNEVTGAYILSIEEKECGLTETDFTTTSTEILLNKLQNHNCGGFSPQEWGTYTTYSQD